MPKTFVANRIINSLSALLILGLTAGQARAEYPDHPITLIIPFTPGSALEVVARLFSPYLTQILGQPIVISDKPGADGIIGLAETANAKPDGYTLVFSGGAEVVAPALHRTFPYDPANALRGVALISTSPLVVGMSSKLGVSTFAEFADYVRKHPDTINAASSGNSGRLADAQFAVDLGISAEIVSFDGNAQAATSVATGESDYTVQEPLALASFAQAGKIKIIVAASDKRLSTFPDVPTSKEVGLPDFIVGADHAIYAAFATPPDVVDKLNAAISKVLQMPEVMGPLEALQTVPADGSMNAQQFNAYYLDKLKTWKDVVVRAKIQPLD